MKELGEVANIWTYPVKSLHRVEHALIAVQEDGLAGDRRAALYVNSEHARTGKTYRGKENNLLHLIVEPDEARSVAESRGVEVEVHAGERYFDARPVSLILDRWIAEVETALGKSLDPLRWRPNFYVRSQVNPKESDLIGKRLALGSVVLRVLKSIGRCVTTTYDQTTGVSDPDVLGYVARERDNQMGIYCEVERPGEVRRGDGVRVIE
ncbi:MAG: MOSC domain-containing protein [Vulcanimicrobiaceae bacterium]